ncbi:MAG: hypothetical protein GY926_18930 [bacterium]|nr:hypothetical protein [bacterium]
MTPEILVGLVASIFGGAFVATANQLFVRRRTAAEVRKFEAEAAKVQAETTKLLLEIGSSGKLVGVGNQDPPLGWTVWGNALESYEIGTDPEVFRSGKASGRIRSIGPADGFGTLMQTFEADQFAGSRLRMSAYVRIRNVEGWAGLWMRVDGEEGHTAFDNMFNRQLSGSSDWTYYEVVLDVDVDSLQIAFGLLLNGEGTAWIDDVAFDLVGDDVAVTDRSEIVSRAQAAPSNLKFDQ